MHTEMAQMDWIKTEAVTERSDLAHMFIAVKSFTEMNINQSQWMVHHVYFPTLWYILHPIFKSKLWNYSKIIYVPVQIPIYKNPFFKKR